MEPNPLTAQGTRLLRTIAEQHLIGCTTDAHDRRADVDPNLHHAQVALAAAIELLRATSFAVASRLAADSAGMSEWRALVLRECMVSWDDGAAQPGQGRLL